MIRRWRFVLRVLHSEILGKATDGLVGLFRVEQVDMGERSVNVEAEHVRPRGNPA